MPFESTFSVILTNPLTISGELFCHWLHGCTDTRSIDLTRKTLNSHTLIVSDISFTAFVHTQYRLFSEIETYLQRPRFFIDQVSFPLPLTLKRTLIEDYFGLDGPVVRELVDKKMTAKSRSYLDDISARTGVSLASCRRQFENIRRVFRKVEDVPGDLVSNIRRKFFLSRPLANRYACVVFLNKNRIEVGKRRVPERLDLDDILACTLVFVEHWTSAKTTLEFDYNLAQDLRDLKTLIGREAMDDCYAAFASGLAHGHAKGIVSGAVTEDLFRHLLRAALQLGSGLSQAKEVRDLFISLCEQIVVVFEQLALTPAQIELVFTDGLGSVVEGTPSLNRARFGPPWARLVEGLRLCTQALIHKR